MEITAIHWQTLTTVINVKEFDLQEMHKQVSAHPCFLVLELSQELRLSAYSILLLQATPQIDC